MPGVESDRWEAMKSNCELDWEAFRSNRKSTTSESYFCEEGDKQDAFWMILPSLSSHLLVWGKLALRRGGVSVTLEGVKLPAW